MKIKNITQWGFFLCSFLWPVLSYAQQEQSLAPIDTDLSVRFLSNIFGVVDGVLHGSGSQIFGAMFGVFNAAVLTMGMAILGYTLFVATLRTAHEGEALGREWSSIWIPLRSAAGFALMLPKASGYSIIQILVMWTVVQGVGAANLVWNAALDYLAAGGSIVQPQQAPPAGGTQMVGDILRAETCMYMLEEALGEDAKTKAEASGDTRATTIPSFFQTVSSPTPKSQPDYSIEKGKFKIYFPGKLYNSDGTEYKNFMGVCGNISWEGVPQTSGPTGSPGRNLPSGVVINAPLPTDTSGAARQLSDAKNLAVLQVIMSLSSSAQQLAADYGPFPDAKKSALKTTIGAQNILIDTLNDYQGIMAPALNAVNRQTSGSGLTNFIRQAKAEGWIMAGSYYNYLVSLNKNTVLGSSTFPTVTFKWPPEESLPIPTLIKTDTSLTPFFTKEGDNTLMSYIKKQSDKASEIAGSAKGPISEWYKGIAGENEGVSGFSSNLVAFLSPIATIFAAYYQLLAQTGDIGQNPVSPVTAAAILGSGLISFVAQAWIIGAATMFGLTAIVSVCPAANPMGNAAQVVVAWFVPMLTVLLVLMFTMGATLTYYIPLVPYILFLFGSIGWIIGVMESIAAAPLVALGIIYPEEHQVLGKAQPAVMLLTNIFVRPSLMIIGFIAGISLSYVAVWLLNKGFSNALTALTPGTKGWAWIFMGISILSIYTVLIVEIINRAFSLIHVLPDEVLRWVGGGHRQLGAETSKAEEAVRGGATGDIKQGSQAMAQSTGDVAKARAAEKPPKGGAEPGKKPGNPAIQVANQDGGNPPGGNPPGGNPPR